MRSVIAIVLLFTASDCTTPSVRYTTLSRDPLFVIGAGEGTPPVVVLHGGPGLRHNYLRPEFERLTKHHQVIFYDQRGCGQSTTEGSLSWEQHVADLHSLVVDVLQSSQVFLIGSSWGSALALLFAERHPQLVQAVVTSGLPGWPDAVEHRRVDALRDSLTALTRQRARAIHPDTAPASAPVDSARAVQKQAPVLGEDLAARLGTMCPHVLFQVSRSFVTAPPLTALETIRMPVLLVHGNEQMRDGKAAQRVREVMPNATVFAVPDAGHDPWFETPEQFFEVVDAFLDLHKRASRE